MKIEYELMQIIAYAGQARSKYIESIRLAKDSDFERARQLMIEGDKELDIADTLNADIFSLYPEIMVTMLAVHSQDYLMHASTLKELAGILIDFMEGKEI